jgi:shikimate dehydrogenase
LRVRGARRPIHFSDSKFRSTRYPRGLPEPLTRRLATQATMQITGHTELIAHLGYPTHAFKAPMIYNPYFESAGIQAVVVPMGCKPELFASFLPSLFQLTNMRGALITMPHKVSVVDLLDEVTPTVKVAGACNAVKRTTDGRLVGDMFDGEGFVRGLQRKGLRLQGASALVVGSGGVARLRLFDVNEESAKALAQRIATHYPGIHVELGNRDPQGVDLAVNATPLGMNVGDPLPMDMDRLAPRTFVGEVVMRAETTAFLAAAQSRGCQVQVGTDMLFEQIPAYLEFFGLPTTTAENLRTLARLQY